MGAGERDLLADGQRELVGDGKPEMANGSWLEMANVRWRTCHMVSAMILFFHVKISSPSKLQSA